MIVRLLADLVRADGGVFEAGLELVVFREFEVKVGNGRCEKRYALVDFGGCVVLPCVTPNRVEKVN